MPLNTNNVSFNTIVEIANKVNRKLSVFIDKSYFVVDFLFLRLSLLGEQCPDGRFLLVGNSQALLIIAVAMAARSCGTLF